MGIARLSKVTGNVIIAVGYPFTTKRERLNDEVRTYLARDELPLLSMVS